MSVCHFSTLAPHHFQALHSSISIVPYYRHHGDDDDGGGGDGDDEHLPFVLNQVPIEKMEVVFLALPSTPGCLGCCFFSCSDLQPA